MNITKRIKHLNNTNNRDFANIYDHRAATPLELLFDLVFVVIVAALASDLHHSFQHENYRSGLLTFIIGAIAMIRVWMDYTWISSAFDDNSLFFRILTLVQMFGVIIYASGLTLIPVESVNSIVVMSSGYTLARIASIILLIYTAIKHSQFAAICYKYIAILIAIQSIWIINAIFNSSLSFLVLFILFIDYALLFLLAKPSKNGSFFPFNAHHITERYGLLVIIILGETIVAIVNTINNLITENSTTQIWIVGSALIMLTFSIWWSYFQMNFTTILQKGQKKKATLPVLLFSYGHLIIFASLISTAAAYEIIADVYFKNSQSTGHQNHTEPYFVMLILNINLLIFTLAIIFMKYITSAMPKSFWKTGICIAIINALVAFSITYLTDNISYGLYTLVIGQIIQISGFFKYNNKFNSFNDHKRNLEKDSIKSAQEQHLN